ncbi:hypothetical protein AX15_006737 [Amanita polypyramis BW_CC]|nr:hypothetical protein AX15_006737 [Amanita polypyramis BW_CC]
MRLASLLIGLGSAIVVSSSTINARQIPSGFSAGNHYNAPIPPWVVGAQPGWYYGNYPGNHPGLFCLTPLICTLLDILHLGFLCPSRTPPTTDGYYETFNNLTGATEASDYLTYGLVDTVTECLAMCNSVTGCSFVNSMLVCLFSLPDMVILII